MDTRRDIRLGAADSAWWGMEEPVNQMTITAVLTFGARVDFARVRELVVARLLPLAPFRHRLRRPRLGVGIPRWVPDREFDLDRHLRRATLSPPGDDGALQALVSRLMSQPLDRHYPLWEFHFVERYGDGSALVARIHHCIADGVALIHLLLTLDDVPGNEGIANTWAQNGALPARTLRMATVGAAARALGRLVVLPPDPRGRLRGPLQTRKHAAWSPPFALGELRAASRARGCTINDLLVAAAAGALRTYLAHDARETRRVRAVVPVNLRRPDEVGTMGNRFGLVFLALPVGVADPAERLRRVHDEMVRLKASCEAGVTYGLMALFGPLGRVAVRLAVRFLGWKASLVFTDVPGPRETVWFAGAPLTSVMAWVPQSGRLSLGMSVLSYAGQVQVGMAADAGLIPDPGALLEAYRAALAELLEPPCERGSVPAPAPVGAAGLPPRTGPDPADAPEPALQEA
ncbi:MAG TPA: wax ester/triacylglycerol synthase family O-acyltransferase [Longimicrobium sp.]